MRAANSMYVAKTLSAVSRTSEKAVVPPGHRIPPSKFLAAVGLDCLAEYVVSRSLTPPSALTEDEIAKWLEQLNDAVRAAVLEDWQSINDVADYAVNVLDLAYRRSTLTPDDAAPCKRVAMVLFLEERASFEIASDLYDWRDATMCMSHYRLPEHPDRSPIPDTDEFQVMVSEHFRESMRSENCIVRAYEDAGVWIMLVAHSDYQQMQPTKTNFRTFESPRRSLDCRQQGEL